MYRFEFQPTNHKAVSMYLHKLHVTYQRRPVLSDRCAGASSVGVCWNILRPEPPNRALGQKSCRRTIKKKVSFRSDHSRCEIGIDHLKLEPTDRQQGPHVCRFCSSCVPLGSLLSKFTVKELNLNGFRHGILMSGFSQIKRFRLVWCFSWPIFWWK